ncbi:MAG: hypothetical protein JSR66_27550 [Proteobacteria bacterium]|nr:hypothetical protein [Pseudomonadota bacterium]
MRQLFLGMSAAALISMGGLVAAQTAETRTKLVQPSVDKPVETATQPDPGTKMRLAAMDTSDAAFRKLDEDKDGRISPLEAANNPRVAAAFTMADKDKDGYLSKEEFEAMNPSSSSAHPEVDASKPAGDRVTAPSGDRAATSPNGDHVATAPSGDRVATAPSGDHVSNPSGDQRATGPNEPTPADNSQPPRWVAHPRH